MQELENVKNQFLIADYHVMGEEKDVKKTKENIFEVIKDWIAVGLDPEKSDFVIQSYLPESAELTMFLSMLTPITKLYNNPTLKEEIRQLDKDNNSKETTISTAFFNYPISQAADILLPKADIVPV
jgi:tryptophanyl-tRNA synthetase